MTRAHRTLVSSALLLALSAGACAREGREPAAGAARTTVQTVAAGEVNIAFRSDPDPPRSGDNAYEVTLRRKDGTPITDATVTAVFSMPAMSTMNMPAMRSDASLAHIGNGTYRGTGQLSMGGLWNVVVSVARGTEPPSTARFSVIAR